MSGIKAHCGGLKCLAANVAAPGRACQIDPLMATSTPCQIEEWQMVEA